MKVKITRNPERYGCKSINKASEGIKAETSAKMKINKEIRFTIDATKARITFICEDSNRDIITAYTGIETNARLGENLIKIYIPASSMKNLIEEWKITENHKKIDF